MPTQFVESSRSASAKMSRADSISERDNERARVLPPVNYADVLTYWSTLAAVGMYQADDLVDEMRDALRRAESFGDIFGIISSQWAYGTALLRADKASHDEAIDVLERAQANIQKHRVFILALATIGADLAIDAAHRGQRDEQSMNFVPRSRCTRVAAVESSLAVRARPW